MGLKAIVYLLGMILSTIGSYQVVEVDDHLTYNNERAGTVSEIVREDQEVDHTAISAVKTGDQRVTLNSQWGYIFSDPMYLLLVAIAILLNIVLLRKLVKKEL
ncbi:MAG: hypothetical protein AAF944_13210 [Bacteroidota bacterium]